MPSVHLRSLLNKIRKRLTMLFRLLHMLCAITVLLCSSACMSSTVKHVPPEHIREHIQAFGIKPTQHILIVDTAKQELAHLIGNQLKTTYTISTSNRGIGQKVHTFQTPRGLHRINEKIGDGIPAYGIFHRRQFTRVWDKKPRDRHFKDYVSTRILRLEGLQEGYNRGRDSRGQLVDTAQRAVYIHGTTMEWKLGSPSTKGCVHMSAKDVIQLFNQVPLGTLVWIY